MNLFSSLTNRIFLASAALVIVSIAVAVLRVNAFVTARADVELHHGLDEAAALVDEFSRAQFEQFQREARLVAGLPDINNAVSVADPRTVQPIADEYQQDINADVFVVLDRSDRMLARAGRIAPENAPLEAIMAARPAPGATAWFWPYADGVLHLTAVPIEFAGTLIVGSTIDRVAAERIRTITRSDIAFVAGSRVVASTVAPDRAAALVDVAGRGDSSWVGTLGGEEFVARVLPLGEPAELSRGGPVAIVLRSRTEQLRFLQALHREIILTGLVAVFVATLLGYFIARTVTRPLRAVTATMNEMAATGDLARRGPALGRWDDEDARLLATTFRDLTAALDRFQREAAQRERLSSLGRLSTVVAHEVRNPLMIIKSALRGLRRDPAPEEVVQAAASIEEEVTRLNRVVTDVLDFARPIPLEVAPTDLVDLCRSAAQAAGSGSDDVRIVVHNGVERAAILTDGERLRGVLVNVLTNAQHAVRARPGAPAEVRLRLGERADGWRIEVEDEGTGIAAADLSRVFEPFFTTRRGGSGLGLALARNIIESMGGTIVITSDTGRGTTVRIDLPPAAPGTPREARSASDHA